MQSQIVQYHTAAEGAEPSSLDVHRVINTESLTSRIATALASRDAEIRQVLEGLRRARDMKGNPCWCENLVTMAHEEPCDAARALYSKLKP